MRTEVIYLMAHLLITLVIIGGYIYSVAIGHPDETLKMALIAIIGYWFGAMGGDKIKLALSKKGEKGGEGK